MLRIAHGSSLFFHDILIYCFSIFISQAHALRISNTILYTQLQDGTIKLSCSKAQLLVGESWTQKKKNPALCQRSSDRSRIQMNQVNELCCQALERSASHVNGMDKASVHYSIYPLSFKALEVSTS